MTKQIKTKSKQASNTSILRSASKFHNSENNIDISHFPASLYFSPWLVYFSPLTVAKAWRR